MIFHPKLQLFFRLFDLYISLIHYYIYYNQIIFCWLEKLFQGVLSHFYKCLFYLFTLVANQFNIVYLKKKSTNIFISSYFIWNLSNMFCFGLSFLMVMKLMSINIAWLICRLVPMLQPLWSLLRPPPLISRGWSSPTLRIDRFWMDWRSPYSQGKKWPLLEAADQGRSF